MACMIEVEFHRPGSVSFEDGGITEEFSRGQAEAVYALLVKVADPLKVRSIRAVEFGRGGEEHEFRSSVWRDPATISLPKIDGGGD